MISSCVWMHWCNWFRRPWRPSAFIFLPVFRSNQVSSTVARLQAAVDAGSRFFNASLLNFRQSIRVLSLRVAPVLIFGATVAIYTRALAQRKMQSTTPNFGPNVTVFDASTPNAVIQAKLDSISSETEFSTHRHAVLFMPGQYDVNSHVGTTRRLLVSEHRRTMSSSRGLPGMGTRRVLLHERRPRDCCRSRNPCTEINGHVDQRCRDRVPEWAWLDPTRRQRCGRFSESNLQT